MNRLEDWFRQLTSEEPTERPRHAVLTEDGEVMPCDLITWAMYFEKGRAQRVLVQEELPGAYFISTIFLGLDHNYSPQGPPLWFETMIFEPRRMRKSLITGKEEMSLGDEIFMNRYTTLKEALDGHEAAKEWFASRGKKQGTPHVRGRSLGDL